MKIGEEEIREMMMVKLEIATKLAELKSGWRAFTGDLVVGLL